MHHARTLLLCAVLVAACSPRESAGQADPYWMRSWNEAQATRPAAMSSRSRIAPAEEPGAPLVVRGQVLEPGGRAPAAGIVVHAYHRDSQGFDFGPGDRATSTWRLQGWAKTDAEGRFEFRTIRPAPDHLGREGPHVHITLESPQFGRQWTPILYLKDRTEAIDGVQYVSVTLQLKRTGDF